MIELAASSTIQFVRNSLKAWLNQKAWEEEGGIVLEMSWMGYGLVKERLS